MATADVNDPCAMLAALRPVYYALLTGESVQEIEFRAGNGTTRRVRYSAVDLVALRTEIAQLEAKCAASGRARRHAIIAG